MKDLDNFKKDNVFDFIEESYEFNVQALGTPLADKIEELKIIQANITKSMELISVPRIFVKEIDKENRTVTMDTIPGITIITPENINDVVPKSILDMVVKWAETTFPNLKK